MLFSFRIIVVTFILLVTSLEGSLADPTIRPYAYNRNVNAPWPKKAFEDIENVTEIIRKCLESDPDVKDNLPFMRTAPKDSFVGQKKLQEIALEYMRECMVRELEKRPKLKISSEKLTVSPMQSGELGDNWNVIYNGYDAYCEGVMSKTNILSSFWSWILNALRKQKPDNYACPCY